MESQSKQDLVAGISILLMFVGAFILTRSSLGLLLIAGGGISVLLLMAGSFRKLR